MAEDDLRRLGERRKLIFQNVANGVQVEDIMAAFSASREDIDRAVAFVAKKVKEYRFRRAAPPIPCDTVADIRWNRLALLETISKLGPMWLSSELLLPKVTTQKLDHPSMLTEATERMKRA